MRKVTRAIRIGSIPERVSVTGNAPFRARLGYLARKGFESSQINVSVDLKAAGKALGSKESIQRAATRADDHNRGWPALGRTQ